LNDDDQDKSIVVWVFDPATLITLTGAFGTTAAHITMIVELVLTPTTFFALIKTS
jgi:hypothetical protein